jgi:hypothetical protein
MKRCPTGLASSWLETEGSGPRPAQGEPPDEEKAYSSGDQFECIPLRESTRGLNDRFESGCWPRFSLATALRFFSTSLTVLLAAEPSSVVTKGSVAV